MTAEGLAQVLEEWVYAARPMANDQLLEYEDILQMVYMSNSYNLNKKFEKDELDNSALALGEVLNTYSLDIRTDEYGRKVADLPPDVIHLQSGAGVFSIVPLDGNGHPIQCKPFIRMAAGSEWLYCGDSSEPFSYFTYYKDLLVFYNLDSCIKKVLANVVTNSNDSTIPDDIAWDVFNQVRVVIYDMWKVPIDKRMDGNPTAEQIFQTKLTSPQVNR
jgi:hypothetical protein